MTARTNQRKDLNQTKRSLRRKKNKILGKVKARRKRMRRRKVRKRKIKVKILKKIRKIELRKFQKYKIKMIKTASCQG